MPFAGYLNFQNCLEDQIKKGRSKLSAQRICGYLQSKYEKQNNSKANLKKVKGTITKKTGIKSFPTIRITEQYYRFRPRGRNPKKYVRFRTKTLNKTKGIKAIIGFKKSGGSEIQSYLFLKSKWTPTKAKIWLKEYRKKNINLTYNEVVGLSQVKEDIKMDKNEIKKELEEKVEKIEEKKEIPIPETDNKVEEKKDGKIVEEPKEIIEEPVKEEKKEPEEEIIQENDVKETKEIPIEEKTIEEKSSFKEELKAIQEQMGVIDELTTELKDTSLAFKKTLEELKVIKLEKNTLTKKVEGLTSLVKTQQEDLKLYIQKEKDIEELAFNQKIETIVEKQINMGTVREELKDARISALKKMTPEGLKMVEEIIDSTYNKKEKEPEGLTKRTVPNIVLKKDVKDMSRKEFFTGIAHYLDSHKDK